eukprot:3505012-Rhodomonas_salina.1
MCFVRWRIDNGGLYKLCDAIVRVKVGLQGERQAELLSAPRASWTAISVGCRRLVDNFRHACAVCYTALPSCTPLYGSGTAQPSRQ